MTQADTSDPAISTKQQGKGFLGSVGKAWNGTANVCGVLALLISVSWTFPKEVVTTYFSTQEAMDRQVNEAIKEMSRVYKEFTLAQSSNLNDQTRFNLTTISTAQIGHELDKLSRLPDSVFDRASYSANLALAGLAYQIPKYDDALRYYDAAIAAAGRERVEPQEAYQGKANALLGRGGSDGVELAREAYKLGLKAALKRQLTGRADFAYAPLAALIEISLGELRAGSWECGNQLAGIVDMQLNQPELKGLPSSQNILALYRANRAAVVKTEGRLPFACDYLLP